MRKYSFEYLCEDRVCSKVDVDEEAEIVKSEDFTDDPVEQAFGGRELTLEGLEDFFRSRCFPETRFNLKYTLSCINMDFFDAETIVRKTRGVLYEDTFWVRFDGEELTWNDVKMSNR
jgi:hypothetical protein